MQAEIKASRKASGQAESISSEALPAAQANPATPALSHHNPPATQQQLLAITTHASRQVPGPIPYQLLNACPPSKWAPKSTHKSIAQSRQRTLLTPRPRIITASPLPTMRYALQSKKRGHVRAEMPQRTPTGPTWGPHHTPRSDPQPPWVNDHRPTSRHPLQSESITDGPETVVVKPHPPQHYLMNLIIGVQMCSNCVSWFFAQADILSNKMWSDKIFILFYV